MTLTPIRHQFLLAADAAARLLSDPSVGARWEEFSALPEFRVSGLAGHLGLQLRYVRDAVAAQEPGGTPRTLQEHYASAGWMNASVDAEANVSVREMGEQSAAGGAAEVGATAMSIAAGLTDSLRVLSPDRLMLVPWADRVMLLDDFLLTRLMEITVHSDDLAVSIGVPTPVLPAEVLEPVIDLLTGLAAQRHGGLALLRALTRQERAPQTIAAF